jgi:hypothetical protein
MRKILIVCLMLGIFCSCTTTKTTWDDIYKMVDSGAYQADVDEAITEIGSETHPASEVVIKFFDALIASKPEDAWKLAETNSPFMQTRKDYEGFLDLHKKSAELFQYKSARITSAQVGKVAGGVRMVKIYFALAFYHKTRNEDDEFTGAYNMSNLTGDWMIFSEDK